MKKKKILQSFPVFGGLVRQPTPHKTSRFLRSLQFFSSRDVYDVLKWTLSTWPELTGVARLMGR